MGKVTEMSGVRGECSQKLGEMLQNPDILFILAAVQKSGYVFQIPCTGRRIEKAEPFPVSEATLM